MERSGFSLLCDMPHPCPAGISVLHFRFLSSTTQTSGRRLVSTQFIWDLWTKGYWGKSFPDHSGFPIAPMLHAHMSTGARTVGLFEALHVTE
jgi:hypothetical protein